MKTIHAVFPKRFHTHISAFFAQQENYNVINLDDDINTFRHYMLMRKEKIEVADIAIIAVFENYSVPLEVQIKELIEKTMEVKLAHINLRLILMLPDSFERDSKLMSNLVSIGVYDIYFKDEFGFEDIIQWIETPKTLADMSKYIKANTFVSTENRPEQNNTSVDVDTEPTKEEIRYVPKAETKIVTKKEIVEVEKVIHRTTTIEQKKIGVLSLSKGAGSTFHATNYSSYLADNDLNVGLYEYPKTTYHKTYLADVFNLFSELDLTEEKQKISIPHKVHKKQDYVADSYEVNKVNVYATNYSLGKIDEFTPSQMLKYINSGKHLLKVIDFGCITDSEIQSESFSDTLLLLDSIIVVVDLLPSSIIPNYSRLKLLKGLFEKLDINVVYIINKFEGEIPKKEYEQLELKPAIHVKDIGYALSIKSMFKKKTAYDFDTSIREHLSRSYTELSNSLGIELINKLKTKQPKHNKFLSLLSR